MTESTTIPAERVFVYVGLDSQSAVRINTTGAVKAAAADAAANFGLPDIEFRFDGGRGHDVGDGPVFTSLIYELSGWPLAKDAVGELVAAAHEPLDGRSGVLRWRLFDDLAQPSRDESFFDDSDDWHVGVCRWGNDASV